MQNQQDYLIYSFILALLGFNLIIALSLSNRIIKPQEDQLLYLSLRNSIILNKEIVMPAVKVSEEDLNKKGDNFSKTVRKTDLEDEYFRSTVKIGSKTAFWEPLFLFVISILGSLSRQIILIKFFNSFIYALSIYMLLSLSRQYFKSDIKNLPVWIAVSFLPYNIIYNQKIMSETLFFFLMTLLIYMLEKSAGKTIMPWLPAILGIVSGLIFLTKSQGIFIACLLVFLYCRNKPGRLLKFTVFFLIIASPWLARNYMVFHKPVIFPTKGAVTLWARNNPVFLYQDGKAGNSLENLALSRALRQKELYDFPPVSGKDEIERQTEIRSAFLKTVGQDPVNYLLMCLIRASLVYRLPAGGDWSLALSLLILAVMGAVFVYNVLNRKMPYMNTAILTYIGISVILNSDTRFRIPFDPLMALSFCVFLKTIIDRRSGFRQGSPTA